MSASCAASLVSTRVNCSAATFKIILLLVIRDTGL